MISLIEDQINNLRGLGLSAANISDPEVDSLRVEKGEYSIVYGSPEAWLTNERWRTMLSNGVCCVLFLSMRLMFYDSGKFNLNDFFISIYPIIISIFFISFYPFMMLCKFQNAMLCHIAGVAASNCLLSLRTFCFSVNIL